MERKLYEAAVRGDVDAFHRLIGENPLILTNYALNSNDNLLDVATKAGQLGIVVEIIRRQPDSVTQVNQDGFLPLEVASALGHVEIVKELISKRAGQDLCRLKGREGRTAIHHAAINGKLEVMDELLSLFPECIRDKTSLGETALHLAVKYFKFEAFKKLLEWLQNDLGMLADLVNAVDKDGNTVLHLAVNKRQRQVVEFLFGNSNICRVVNWNARNSRCLTAMDIMDILILDNNNPISTGIVSIHDDLHVRDILHHAIALTAPPNSVTVVSINNNNNNNNNNNMQAAVDDEDVGNWFTRRLIRQVKGSTSEARNALLVVFVLIATVSFQAGLTPPSNFLKLNNNNNSSGKAPSPAPAGSSRSHNSHEKNWLSLLEDIFLVFNTTALILAVYVMLMLILISELPFKREVYTSMIFMLFTYFISLMNAAAEALVAIEQAYKLSLAFLLAIVCCFCGILICLMVSFYPDIVAQGKRIYNDRLIRKAPPPNQSNPSVNS